VRRRDGFLPHIEASTKHNDKMAKVAGPDAPKKAAVTSASPTNVIRTTIVAITYQGQVDPFPQALRVKGSQATIELGGKKFTAKSVRVNGVVDVEFEIKSPAQRAELLTALKGAGFQQAFLSS
jgi:hypothetical protein